MTPMNCWSCGAANDLDLRQTCSACGAPLVKGGGIFSKPLIFGVVLAFILMQGFCFFCSTRLR